MEEKDLTVISYCHTVNNWTADDLATPETGALIQYKYVIQPVQEFPL